MPKLPLLNKIKTNFPSLKFKNSDLIEHGWNKTVIILDNKIVFSFPKTKEAKSKFKSELKLLPKLSKKITLKIPNYQYLPIDNSFAGYNLVPGKPLSIKYFNKLPSLQQNNIAKQIATFLKELHTFPVSTAKKLEVSNAWSEKDARNYYENQAKTVYKKLNLKDKKSLKHIFDSFSPDNQKSNFKNTLVHQDLTCDHILFDKKSNKISGIIDFGDIQIADPAVDFCKLWEYSEKLVNQVLKAYKSTDKELKSRSFRWYIYQCIGNMYCGITMNRKDYWKKGHTLLKRFPR